MTNRRISFRGATAACRTLASQRTESGRGSMKKSLGRLALHLLLLVGMALAADPRAGAATLYGATSPGASNLYILDPATGAVIQNVGPIGFGVTGLAFDPTDGAFYGVTDNTTRQLITIDKVSGAGTIVGPLTATVTDIAFLPDGTLLGSNIQGLLTINKTTGMATAVGGSYRDWGRCRVRGKQQRDGVSGCE
jgi:hypothetical protein